MKSRFPKDMKFLKSQQLSPYDKQKKTHGFPQIKAFTSFSAHIRAMEPMLLVMVTKVARARSSLLMESRFSLLIMLPKLCWKY